MSDKKNTPYTEAVLSEIQRHFTLLPIGGLSHSNHSSEIHYRGYRIPKDSHIIANLDQIHHDGTVWKNPKTFDPENFLENGKIANLDKLVPFGIGRRSCAGEGLAKMELYIFFASLVKNFEIRLESDDTVPDMVGKQTDVYQPNPFKVRMTARN
jgi:cytochrome P450